MENIKVEFALGRLPATAFALTTRLGFREKHYRLCDIPQSGRALRISIGRRTERVLAALQAVASAMMALRKPGEGGPSCHVHGCAALGQAIHPLPQTEPRHQPQHIGMRRREIEQTRREARNSSTRIRQRSGSRWRRLPHDPQGPDGAPGVSRSAAGSRLLDRHAQRTLNEKRRLKAEGERCLGNLGGTAGQVGWQCDT
jgi:hypothetical protein